MKMIVTIWVILLGTLLSSMAQDLESIQRDLDGSISRLSKQRELIATEKPALGQAFQTTRSDLVEKRRKIRIARMAKSDRDELLKELEKKQYLYQQDHEYITGQLRDYGLKLEIFLLPSERVLHGAALEGLREQGSLPAKTLQSRLAVLETLDQKNGSCTLSSLHLGLARTRKENTRPKTLIESGAATA